MTRLIRNTSIGLFIVVAWLGISLSADPAEECLDYLHTTCGTVNFYPYGAYDYGNPGTCSGSCPTYDGCCDILCDMWGGVGGQPWCDPGGVLGGCYCNAG